jgi:putative tricarboxylic transport membrane protein
VKAGANLTDLVAGLVLFLFAVWYGAAAWMLPKVQMQDVIDSYVYPLVLAVALSFLSLGLILKSLRGGAAELSGSRLPSGKMLRAIVFIFAALIAYIVIFQQLGYLASTILFMIVVLKFMDRTRSFWNILILSVLVSGVCYVLFVILFRIQIPAGILI